MCKAGQLSVNPLTPSSVCMAWFTCVVGLTCKTGHTALKDQMIPLNTEIVQYSDSQTLVCKTTLTPHNFKLTWPSVHVATAE